MNKLEEIIEDYFVDDSVKSQVQYNKLFELMIQYAKYNADVCLENYKSTNSCMTDSSIRLKKWLEQNIND